MRAVDVIIKKREGGELAREEIEFFIAGLTRGEIPDYQAAAWAMAVYFRGMTPREMTDLTMAMAHSGEMLDLSDTVPFAVDKHSTGGVGDKVTLVVEPTVAAGGVPMGKMSGRGLGFSGGTIDKLESIPGFRAALSVDEFKGQLKDIGIVLTGQSGDLAPADGKLYALRDVTGTVQSIPLIASSVMSKKIAGGAQAIVLDVKVGAGAFMSTPKEANALARALVSIGRKAGRKTVAIISDMNQPLGNAVGNALELREALDTLRGNGPADFREHCLLIGGQLLMLAGKAKTAKAAHALMESAWADGRALAKLRQMVERQGGDVRMIDDPNRLPKASLIETVAAPRSGYVAAIHAGEIGLTAVDLGAGRAKKGDPLDYAVGLVIHCKVGQRVKKGEPLFTIHANDAQKLAAAKKRALAAHRFSAARVKPLPLYYKVLQSR
jgi:pyrimidine-nucleoside phosphorylase